MKIVSNRLVLGMLADIVGPALVKGNSPLEQGQYMHLKAEGKDLTAMVVRPDMIVKARINGSLLDEDLFKVLASGKCTVRGDDFSKAIRMSSLLGERQTLEYKPNEDKAPKAEDDVAAEVGSLGLTKPGAKGTKRFDFQCVNMFKDPNLESKEESKVVVNGERFARLVKNLGIAVGNLSGSVDYSSLQIRIKNGKMEMATTNGQQLTQAIFDPVEAPENLTSLIPYKLISAVSAMIQTDKNVSISFSPRTVLFRQTMNIDKAEAIDLTVKISISPERFPDFDSIINSLSFKAKCLVSRDVLKIACDELEIGERTRTRVVFEPSKSLISFQKTDERVKIENHVEVEEPEGDKISLDLSSRHLAVAMDAMSTTATAMEDCDVKKARLFFSGQFSLGLVTMRDDPDEKLKMYFQPFTVEEK